MYFSLFHQHLSSYLNCSPASSSISPSDIMPWHYCTSHLKLPCSLLAHVSPTELEAGRWGISSFKSTNPPSSVTISSLPPVVLEGTSLWGCSVSHYHLPLQGPDWTNFLLCLLNTKPVSFSGVFQFPFKHAYLWNFFHFISPSSYSCISPLPLQLNVIEELIISTSSPPTIPWNHFNFNCLGVLPLPDFCIGS